jgi:hypothetical protein
MHSTFMAACEGGGLALAAGILAGAPGRGGSSGAVLELIGAVVGGILFGIALDSGGHEQWPGYFAGAAVALVACTIARQVVAGASAREGAGAGAIAIIVALFALAVAGLSLVIPPISIVALAALLALWVSRRRRAGRKYEGLRVLR